ncbi:MAG: TIGR00266 family protein [Candidatus Bathyarchaeota archaeon]|nr:TIGR00266 family protein [Candidatus Bathyarchaeota archaeon]
MQKKQNMKERNTIVKYEIKYKPSYSMLVVTLERGEKITAEAGAMTYMDPSIEAHTRKREKSLLGSLGLAIIGSQSFWVNDYTATQGPAEVAFVSAPVGDIEMLEVKPNQGYIIQKAAYIASTENVDLDIKWEGFTKGLFGQGLFMIKATGNGKLFINTFGAIDKHTLQPGQTKIVDNFHLVAFSDTCNYKVTKFGGLKETILGGEGLVTQITGPGDIYIQTKNLNEFVEWLWTLLEPRVRSRAR